MQTWAGTIACAASSWVASVALLTLFKRQGHLQQLQVCVSLPASIVRGLMICYNIITWDTYDFVGAAGRG
jgi:hypothetical protein